MQIKVTVIASKPLKNFSNMSQTPACPILCGPVASSTWRQIARVIFPYMVWNSVLCIKSNLRKTDI